MYLSEVIPISRGITKDSLSYFSKEKLPIGSVVSVPIRGKRAPGLVYSIKNVRDEKSTLRDLPYSLKKLNKVKASLVFLPSFMRAAERTANFYAGSTGAVLSLVIPKSILEDPRKVKINNTPKDDKKETYEKVVLQADREEKFSTYRSLVREAFARKQSVYICFPTIHEVEQFAETSERGISKYTFILHSSLPKAELLKRWKSASGEAHPVLIIATGNFLGIPREDLKNIIVDHESSGAYRTLIRPFIDIRVFAEHLSRELGARLIFGDTFLRIETLYAHDEGDVAELAPLRFRPIAEANQDIIDMRQNKPSTKGSYDAISDELKELIHETRENSENLFIFSGRRGLAPTTVCCDCGGLVRSTKSDAPMVLHKTSRGNIFVCHQNGEIRSAAERCKHCGGWRLTALGAGIQLIEEQVKEKAPKSGVFRVDSDSTNTPKKVAEVVEKFYSTPGSVLIGTEMALPYLSVPIPNTAVASIDSVLAIPDYRIEAKVFSLLLSIRSLTQKKFLVQTRNPSQRVIKYALSGNLLEFYREEIEMRRELNYPPFTYFISVTIEGRRPKIEKEIEEIEESLKDYDISIFSALTSAGAGLQHAHALIRVPSSTWPDNRLIAILRKLPPNIKVQVDPPRLI
ncbi:MAG: hypothetical protein QF858_00920 [Candidatus Pacebacteria bacterium]|jgi:primosomal protein N'|nr:hypothetical protein [bacterium]MDP6527428.1 hypothetical protein [Candidatus Paceibacterota bacterium]MDP6659665.1 hypothetical protein [Candidatus Paceibacterota bacterium]|tara:strand:- start:4640 stop:6529 length:1890 start_codon:yes stop_codon:yes gene_type:complete